MRELTREGLILSDHRRNFKLLPLFSVLLISAYFHIILFTQRIIDLWGIPLSGGVFAICVSFFLIDVVTSHYGLDNAKKLINYSSIIVIIMGLTVIGAFKIIPMAEFSSEKAYVELFGRIDHLLLMGFIVAQWLVYYVNYLIFSRLHGLFKAKQRWIRCLTFTSGGNLLSAIIWLQIYFWGKLEQTYIWILVTTQCLFIFAFEVISLPIAYVIIYLLSKYEYPVPIKYKNFIPKSHWKVKAKHDFNQ